MEYSYESWELISIFIEVDKALEIKVLLKFG